MAIVAYENRRIRTIRSTWIILLLTLLLAGGLAAGFSAMANLDPATGERVGLGSLTAVLAAIISPIVLVPLSVLAAQSFGGEYRFGMIRITLSTFPRRTRVVLAKLWTVILWVLAFMVLATAVTFAVARFFPQYVDFNLDGSIALYVLRSLAYGLGYCLWVFALVLITRNQALSIVLVLLWALLIEPVAVQLLGGKLPWLDKFLPMTAGASFVQGDRMLAGAGLFFGTTVLLLLIGWLLFTRRDA